MGLQEVFMKHNEWLEKYKSRADITSRLTHLTRGGTDKEAFDILCKILDEQCLKAGKGYICGERNACCFQEAPVFSIAENLKYQEELGKNRYSPFGIRVLKEDIYKKGGRPVFYGKTEEYKEILDKTEHWRIVDLELDKPEYKVDWTHEREWRLPSDFKFKYDQIEIILPDSVYYKEFVTWCVDKKHINVLKEIRGIVTLDSLIA